LASLELLLATAEFVSPEGSLEFLIPLKLRVYPSISDFSLQLLTLLELGPKSADNLGLGQMANNFWLVEDTASGLISS
jgi:hypothetical protein